MIEPFPAGTTGIVPVGHFHSSPAVADDGTAGLAITVAPIVDRFRIAQHVAAAVFVPVATRIALNDGATREAQAGDMVLLSPGSTLRLPAAVASGWLRIAAPRRFLSPALPATAPILLRRSAATEAVQRHAAGLRTLLAGPLDHAQARFAAHGLRELLAAATASCAVAITRCERRDEDMLERIIAHVDATLGEPVGIAALCQALGYSRSALYRAAAPAGGLVAVTMQRRLVAVYRALRCPDDRRSIAEIARVHGFADASQFSRRFRRTFGVSAGQVRAAPGAGPADGVLFDPRHAAVFAVAADPDAADRDRGGH